MGWSAHRSFTALTSCVSGGHCIVLECTPNSSDTVELETEDTFCVESKAHAIGGSYAHGDKCNWLIQVRLIVGLLDT